MSCNFHFHAKTFYFHNCAYNFKLYDDLEKKKFQYLTNKIISLYLETLNKTIFY